MRRLYDQLDTDRNGELELGTPFIDNRKAIITIVRNVYSLIFLKKISGVYIWIATDDWWNCGGENRR